MEYRYTFLSGSDRYKAVAATDKSTIIIFGPEEFTTIFEIYDKHGKIGAGTEVIYKEEFYNENKTRNAGNLGAGSTFAAPIVVFGKKYIVPVRKKNT